jgi:hypothetical protein
MIQANVILEILGKPVQNVLEALNTLVAKLGTEKGVKVTQQVTHEPIKAENSEDLYTSFAEVSLELDSINNFFGIMFAYMPAHIELVHPEKHTFTNSDLNEVAGKLVGRLHEYDSITKKALIEREFMAKELHKLAPEFFKKPEDTTKPEPSSESKSEEKED